MFANSTATSVYQPTDEADALAFQVAYHTSKPDALANLLNSNGYHVDSRDREGMYLATTEYMACSENNIANIAKLHNTYEVFNELSLLNTGKTEKAVQKKETSNSFDLSWLGLNQVNKKNPFEVQVNLLTVAVILFVIFLIINYMKNNK